MNEHRTILPKLSEENPTLASILRQIHELYLSPFSDAILQAWTTQLGETLDYKRESYVPRSDLEPPIRDSYDLLERLYDDRFTPLMRLLSDIHEKVERLQTFTPVPLPPVRNDGQSDATAVNTVIALLVICEVNRGNDIVATKTFYELVRLPERRKAHESDVRRAEVKRSGRKGGQVRAAEAKSGHDEVIAAARQLTAAGKKKWSLASILAERFSVSARHVRRILGKADIP